MSKMTKEQKANLKKVKPGRLTKKEARTGVLFILPWIIGAVLFLLYPLGSSLDYAMSNIRITAIGMRKNHVGLANFTYIITKDQNVPELLINYVVSTLISVPIIVVFALIIAMMLNQNIKGKGFFRLIFFLPVIIVSGPILGMLTSQGAGSVSAIDTTAIVAAISNVLPGPLAKPIAEIFENMITILWYTGVQILIFLSSLQKVDRAMYEAAKIDGGSGWECFWKITLPTLKPMIVINTVYTVVFISGNEQNEIINQMVDAMFSGETGKGYGYASALAWMYSILVLLIVGLFTLLLVAKKDVYAKQIKKYQREVKKEKRLRRKIERRSARNAKKIQKARSKHGYKTYDGSGDY